MAMASAVRRSLRIAHFTDIHFQVRPSIGDLLSSAKRVIGAVNLYGLRRVDEFSLDVQRAVVQKVVSLKPGMRVLTFCCPRGR
jgi:hypothetical protein